jgi:hypothetical protein
LLQFLEFYTKGRLKIFMKMDINKNQMH